MAEITRKRHGELMRGLFEILIQHSEPMRASLALEKLESATQMTEYEAGVYPSTGTRRFEKIVRFATIGPVKAGWLVKQKGSWFVTEEGVRAYETYKDSEAFFRQSGLLYRKWKSNQKGLAVESVTDQPGEESIEDNSRITFEQAEEQAWAELEKFLKGMNPFEFQELVADLLRGMGYFVSWVSPPGKDGGVDVIAHPDPLGTQSPRIKAQVKRRADQRVDRQEVQSFLSSIGDTDAGLFVSTSGFTKDAEGFARSQERRKVMLIDLEHFFELWVQFHGKLDDAARRRFPITPIYFLTPEA
jgi:restriction system protein